MTYGVGSEWGRWEVGGNKTREGMDNVNVMINGGEEG